MTQAAIGVMQGRLVPPVAGRIQAFPGANWEAEFPLAAAAQLRCIEWIYDAYGKDVNPLASRSGIDRMRRTMSDTGVAVRSVVADIFMDFPLVRATPEELRDRVSMLLTLLERCVDTGIGRIVLPFVDASSIRTRNDEAQARSAIEAALTTAEGLDIELHLETDLEPEQFARFLEPFPRSTVFVNYDSGNSASLGFRAAEEFAAYGDRVGSVHIKDRVRGGSTVPLGTGDADFDAIFTALDQVGYRGDLILQVARGTPGDELSWARTNREFVERYIESHLR